MMGQQQLQNVQIQQAQQQLQDRQTLQNIAPKYVKKNDQGQPTGFDYDGFSAEAQEKGVSPTTMSQLATMQKTSADTLKARADAGQTTVSTQEKLLGDAYNHMQGIRGETDPQKRQANWQAATAWAQQNGIQGGQALPQQAPDDKTLATIEAQLGMHAQAIADVRNHGDIKKTAAETSEANAKTAESQAAAARSQAEANWYKNNPTAGAPGVPAENVSAADWLAKNPGKTFSDYTIAMKKIVPAYNFNLQNSLPSGPNGQPSQLAQDLANGTKKWSEVVSVRTPLAVKNQLAEQVHALNPDFDTKTYNIAQKVGESATSGQIGQNLTAFNTAIDHAKQLSAATDALGNGDVRALNQIGNTLGYQFGSDKTTNFNVIKNALSGEISKVFKGGGATDAEIEAVQAPFSTANSPEQLKGAINAAVSLMNSKRSALQQQVEQGMKGKPNFGGEQKKYTPPAGAPSATGPNGHKIVVDGGKWVDAETGAPVQ